MGRGVFVGNSLTKKYFKHFCSFCLQMRVRTNIYWLWLCAWSSTPMVSVNTPDSPARELSLPTTSHTASAQNTIRLFSHRLKEAWPLAPLTERRCRQPRLLVAPLAMLARLTHCVCCRFRKGIPESLAAMPFVTQHLQQSLLNRWTAGPWQGHRPSLRELVCTEF